jgi:rubrerythrin
MLGPATKPDTPKSQPSARRETRMSKVDEMVDVLRQWQGLERQAMNDTAEIMEKTTSPLIRVLMEIIRHDSLMHHRVQQFLIDSVTRDSVTVTREDIAEVWDKLEAHDKKERKTIQMAEELRKKAWTPDHKLLLDYLLKDEGKHDSLLQQLDGFKKELGRSSGG